MSGRKRNLRGFEFRTTVVIELYRVVRCPECGSRRRGCSYLHSKARFSKRFEEAAGQACKSAPSLRVVKQLGLAASTVRTINMRYLQWWAQARRRPGLRQMGVDETYLGKKTKVSDGGDKPGEGRAVVVRESAGKNAG